MILISTFMSKLSLYSSLKKKFIVNIYTSNIYKLCILLKIYNYIKNIFIIKIKNNLFIIIELNVLYSKKFVYKIYKKKENNFIKYKQLKFFIMTSGIYIVNTSFGYLSTYKAFYLKKGGLLSMFVNIQ